MDIETKTMRILLALGVAWLLFLVAAPFLFPMAQDATHDPPATRTADGGNPRLDGGTEVSR